MTDFERGVVEATATWRDTRRAELNILNSGLSTGDMAGLKPDPYSDPEDDPDTSEIEEALLQAAKTPNTGATHGFAIGHQTQLNLLEARNRTAMVRRIGRRGALALVRGELEDGRRRDDQLETLIVLDDAPEGIGEDSA